MKDKQSIERILRLEKWSRELSAEFSRVKKQSLDADKSALKSAQRTSAYKGQLTQFKNEHEISHQNIEKQFDAFYKNDLRFATFEQKIEYKINHSFILRFLFGYPKSVSRNSPSGVSTRSSLNPRTSSGFLCFFGRIPELLFRLSQKIIH